MKSLEQVKPGQTVSVVRLHGEGAIKRRIMDMGITKGVTVFVRKVAPLGDPMEVTVRNRSTITFGVPNPILRAAPVPAASFCGGVSGSKQLA